MMFPHNRYFSPLLARDRNAPHRSSTQLELFFDLVIVIAIAVAAHGLFHEVGEGHIVMGAIKYLMAFFAIWWLWNMFTWFASSFDNDDGAYRITVNYVNECSNQEKFVNSNV